MKKLISLASPKFLQMMRLPAKFGVLAVLMTIPTALLLWGAWQSNKAVTDFAKSESSGAKYLRLIDPLVLPLHRHHLALRFPKVEAAAKLRPDAVSAVDGQLAKLEASQAQFEASLGTGAIVAEIRKSWALIKAMPESNPELVATAHLRLVDAIQLLREHVGDKSGLVLDPDPDTYYLMDGVLIQMPQLMHSLTELRRVVYLRAFDGESGFGPRAEVLKNVAAIRSRAETLEQHFYKVRAANPQAGQKLASTLQVLRGVRGLVDKWADRAGSNTMVEFDSKSFGAELFSTNESVRDTLSAWSQELEQLLQNRIDLKNSELRSYLAVVGLCLALAAIMFISVYLSLHNGFMMLTDKLRNVGEGDLSSPMRVHGRDEVADLAAALNAMSEKLSVVVGDIRVAGDAIGSVSNQVAGAAQSLAVRTEESGASLEQTAQAMEELTVTVRTNADNSRDVGSLAHESAGLAVNAGEMVSEVVGRMTSISQSSKRIGNIISVIDGIAFQTNILALNAAVEAARAGEQGRGFAVVATEVRNLAQRSAAAAKEIKSLIESSVLETTQGSRIVNKAGDSMQQVVDSVKRLSQMIGEISHSSEEQAKGIESANRAISDLQRVTQENTAMVEESAGAATVLDQQSRGLVKTVASFKLKR
jgi:methyl-accepting chemotaxis protein